MRLTILHNSRQRNHTSKLYRQLLTPTGVCKAPNHISKKQTEHILVQFCTEGQSEHVVCSHHRCSLTCNGVHPCVSVSRTEASPFVSNVCMPPILPVLQNSKISESSGTAAKVLRVFLHPRQDFEMLALMPNLMPNRVSQGAGCQVK